MKQDPIDIAYNQYQRSADSVHTVFSRQLIFKWLQFDASYHDDILSKLCVHQLNIEILIQELSPRDRYEEELTYLQREVKVLQVLISNHEIIHEKLNQNENRGRI